MSLTMKTLMTALLLIAVTAQWNTASAQLSQGRLWSPPRSDQFGGYGRLREGMFGEIDYNYWVITKGSNTTIGWVDPIGKQNPYYSGLGLFLNRTNTMSTSSLGNNFTGGTTLRIGNMIKHHGWEIKSTIMQAQRDSYEGRYGSMDIKGDNVGDVLVSVLPPGATTIYHYDPHEMVLWYDADTMPVPATPYMQAGYLWGWFALDNNVYELAPLPLVFERYTLDSKVSHWDIEANYIFRPHATRIGFFEFTGGVRYMQLDDSLTFSGWLPWRTTQYSETNTGTGTGTGGTTTGTTVNIDNPNTIWNFNAENHLVGPQVGIRYIKKCSGRWSLIADTKFFAGFNTQNIKSDGVMGIRTDIYNSIENDPNATGTSPIAPGIYDPDPGALMDMRVPLGFAHNPGSFRHSETRTAFSPGIDFSLKANWQFTDAIAFNAGYNGIYLDRTARATLINNYEIDYNGNVFGINGNVEQSTWMHGVSLGLTINRH